MRGLKIQNPSPIEIVESPLLKEKKVQLYIKRDDLLHPLVSGNKWRKLKYNLQYLEEKGYSSFLTFGGAFSNHILAASAIARYYGVQAHLVVRGDGEDPQNPTTKACMKLGANIIYCDRQTYRKKEEKEILNGFMKRTKASYYIPEGGTNALALKGCVEIMEEVRKQSDLSWDYIALSTATGGTAAGILQSLYQSNDEKLLAFSALKGTFLRDEILGLQDSSQLIELQDRLINLPNYHFGGYAKTKPALLEFITQFHRDHKILLDPIYTGKMLWGVFDLIKKDYFAKGTRILVVHTGGTQGNLGFNYRFGNLIPQPHLGLLE